MARNVKITGKRNQFEGSCRFCKKTVRPGMGLLWRHNGTWYVKCADGCHNHYAAVFVRYVDTVDRFGRAVIRELFSDGSIR